ncbi:unknown [Bacteroides sp. CAG:633]|nr:unknown [Bacteroides sp. CAG:633]
MQIIECTTTRKQDKHHQDGDIRLTLTQVLKLQTLILLFTELVIVMRMSASDFIRFSQLTDGITQQ